MKKHLLFPILAFLFVCINFQGLAQVKIPTAFRESVSPTSRSGGEQLIQAEQFRVYELDLDLIKNGLSVAAHRDNQAQSTELHLDLPFPDGSLHTYKVLENSTMSTGLAAKFPEIKSYDGYGISHPGEFVKFDITPQGFHAMVMLPGENMVFIDPLFKGETELHMVYHKNDFQTTKTASCLVAEERSAISQENESTRAPYASCNLRTYRLALAATGEYTAFHGGTVALAQAAQVTTMNRVNGIYEKNLGITMTLVPNNNLVIYTNSATDPYSNGNASTMINQNQTNITNVIGSANYDIGHVFGTNSGGIAGLGVVCNSSNKARGVTGSNAPIGDPFDVDYVAHEMGHQFGANHTQNNSCQRNTTTAMEPGSASTIMGYAGICSPNVQNNSDAFFHGVSLREIGLFISGWSHTCPVVSNLNNTAPVIASTNGNVTIPKGTPFALTGVASDADNDILTYNWEQMNNQSSTQPPVATSTGGPNFRSFMPSANPTRYFPRLQALANNGPFTWEVLPTVARTMNFRLTVQDNHQVASCNDYKDVTVTVNAGSGPFVVLSPNSTGIVWGSASTETVTWDVAGTNVSPVNCQTVDIFLSTDGGLTFPHVLATGVPNNGSSQVAVPALTTNTARVMVMASAGTFFNVSRFNFNISSSGYSLAAPQSSTTACLPEAAVYNINVNSIGGFSDPVILSLTGLPAGATYGFNPGVVNPGSSSTLTINSTLGVNPANYPLTVTGTSNSTSKNITIYYNAVLINKGVVQNGDILTSEHNIGTFQWLDCRNGNAPIPNAKSKSFTPTESGSYAVMVTASGCSDVSDCIEMDFTGIAALKTSGIKVYPNPARNILNISWEGQNMQALSLTDIQGRELLHVAMPQNNSASFDLSGFSGGLYFLRIENNGHREFLKIIKE